MTCNRNDFRRTCWHYLATVRLWLAKVSCRITISNSPSSEKERRCNSLPQTYLGDPGFKSLSPYWLWWLRLSGFPLAPCMQFVSQCLILHQNRFLSHHFQFSITVFWSYFTNRLHRQINRQYWNKLIVRWLLQPKLSCFSFACDLPYPCIFFSVIILTIWRS